MAKPTVKTQVGYDVESGNHYEDSSIHLTFSNASCQQLDNGQVRLILKGVRHDDDTQRKLSALLRDAGYSQRDVDTMSHNLYEMCIARLLRERQILE